MNNDYIVSPLRTAFQTDPLSSLNMPDVLREIMEDYAPEFQTKMAQITLTFWESIRNLVLSVLTLGYLNHYQTKKYNQVLLDSEDGSGIPSAIEAIKWGANTRPNDGVLDSIQEKQQYKEYDFAYAQYLPTERYQRDLHFHGRNLPFELSSPLRDKKIWAIQSKYKSVFWAEESLFALYSPLEDKNNIALIVERFHTLWGNFTKHAILKKFVKLNDLQSVQVILNALRHDQNLLKYKDFHDVPDEDNYRISIVHLAIKLGFYEMLELLVAQNLPIDPEDYYRVRQQRDKQAISILLQSPSIIVSDSAINGEWDRCIKEEFPSPNPNLEILEILIKHHKNPLKAAIDARNITLIQFLGTHCGIRPTIDHVLPLGGIEDSDLYSALVPYAPKSDKITERVDANSKKASEIASFWQRIRMLLERETKESLDD